MLPAIPTPIPMPFAQNGERRAIPETNTVPGSADVSWSAGFPPVTRINKQAGGKPPFGLDFQGLFHDITEHLCYTQAGNLYPWVGASEGQPGLDYLKGAIVRGSDGRAYIALKASGPATPNPDGAGVVGPVDPVGDTSGHWADVMAMLGSSLLYNDETIITESGTFVAPVEGWYQVHIINGGHGGRTNFGASHMGAYGGRAGARATHLVYLTAGEEVAVTIGAGGLGGDAGAPNTAGGGTSFGTYTTGEHPAVWMREGVDMAQTAAFSGIRGQGAGEGGGPASSSGMDTSKAGYKYNRACDATWYGGGGGSVTMNTGFRCSGNGKQGAVILRFWNPAKAAGPLPTPALFMARAAARVATQPAVVNLYDPETGQGSVWLEEDAPAKLAEGLITQEAWREICAAKAAEERAAWLASPDTEGERFDLLRTARDARLSATDYLVVPDYPLIGEQRAAVTLYRQALRDLPAQDGAPWDGGGELTPWPAEPKVEKVKDQE